VGGSGGGFGNERVAEVRRRIARGYYHSLAVRHKIAADVGRVLRGIDRL
jgi:hypothetical protein